MAIVSAILSVAGGVISAFLCKDITDISQLTNSTKNEGQRKREHNIHRASDAMSC